MISVVLYGRNDNYGYNLHKRAALSFNCMAEVLTGENDEILFVDYNTPNDFPTFPEAIQDTLTSKAREKLRILRVRPHVHARFKSRTRLVALEPIARNVAVRRATPSNRWILSTNTDMIFVLNRGSSLTEVAADLPKGFYHAPRIEIPETLWESLDRRDPSEAIETIRAWGSALHLNEIVLGSENILYDGPGDFQLIERRDLFDCHGFDENMLLGWHVDSNISRRLRFIHGRVGDLGKEVYGYHCDHTRQVTAMHSHTRTQNDMRTFIDNLVRPDLPDQADTWGCADEEIEEVRLASNGFVGYVKSLREAVGAPLDLPRTVAYTRESYNNADYDIRHVLPFLADMFFSYPRTASIGWCGVRPDHLRLFAKVWRAIGFTGSILVPPSARLDDADATLPGVGVAEESEIHARAAAFVFDFGALSDLHDRNGGSASVAELEPTLVVFLRVIACERERMQNGEPLRPIVALNAVHNIVERFVCGHIGASVTPFSTRMRHGFVLPLLIEDEWLPTLQLGEIGVRKEGSIENINRRLGCLAFGPYKVLPPDRYQITIAMESDEASKVAAGSQCLLIEVLSADELVGLRQVTRAELDKGTVDVEVHLPERLAKSLYGSIEMRIHVRAPIHVRLRGATIRRVTAELPVVAGDEPYLLRLQNWLPMLVVGSAGEVANDGSVVARKQVPGAVVYGPYYAIPAGFYEMVARIELVETFAGLGHVGRAEIVWGTEVVASRWLGMKELVSGEVHIAFEIPPSVEGNAQQTIETRFVSHGHASFRIRSVTVETRRPAVEDTDPAGAALHRLDDWLPFLFLGSAGQWSEQGVATSKGQVGHVVYGPYQTLPPGSYELTLTVEISEPADAGTVRLSADVVAEGVELAACDFALTASPAARNTLRVLFEVPQVPPGAAAPRLETRVWTHGDAAFLIRSMYVKSVSY